MAIKHRERDAFLAGWASSCRPPLPPPPRRLCCTHRRPDSPPLLFCCCSKGGQCFHKAPPPLPFAPIRLKLATTRTRRMSLLLVVSDKWDEYSKPETSDSDKESDYMTGLEDFPEGSTHSPPPQAPDLFPYLSDVSQTSSFIQSILCEDSSAGVAVVDLFVAIKAVKDKMDQLARCNSQVFCRITDLNRETTSIRAGYKDLMANTLAFLDRIKTENPPSHLTNHSPPASPRDLSPTPPQSDISDKPLKQFPDDSCRCRCGSAGSEATRAPNTCCLGCLLSVLGERPPAQPPLVNEALLGSLIASLLWWHKGKTGSKRQRQTSNTGRKRLNLTESNIQMVCDICEILAGSPPPLYLSAEDPHDPHSEHKSRDSSRSKDDAASDGESIFEEALAEPATPCPAPEPRGGHNVTCMGDLSDQSYGKKNVSTFTANSDTASSWLGKLADDIRTKLRRIKSKTKVTVLERPYTSRKAPHNLWGALEFAITANTPVGVFDVTVLQYRKRREKGFVNRRRLTTDVRGRNIPRGSHQPLIPPLISSPPDDSFLEDFYDNSESSEETSDDDMEDFLEIYLDDRKATPRQQATATTLIFKLAHSPLFEIWKRYPALFVLQVMRKMATPHSDHHIIPFTAGKQKEVVIRRSSSDLVIYIQVEVEEGRRSAGAGLSMEYQRTTLGTQTQSFVGGKERVIRLEKEQQNGESLYHIWRGCETGSLGEAEERERITFEEPLVMMGAVKEKAVPFSEAQIEREIRETNPEEPEEGEEDVLETATATFVTMLNAKLRADIWLVQNESRVVERMEKARRIFQSDFELQKALNLVREIENDVVEVKLSDAISILPQLESELRKHLYNKMRRIGDASPEKDCSVDNFFSAVDFWPDEGPIPIEGSGSEERLHNLLKLLSDLEAAVKSNECFARNLPNTSTKVCTLLHTLTDSIRQLEASPDVNGLSQTLDMASQLDTAVREYDSVIKKQPLEHYAPGKEEPGSNSLEDVRHLHAVRKKVFQMVEEEAIDMEGRIERDFDRLDRLEGENDEAMKFLEAFLQKTERRATELDRLKVDLKELASSMSDSYENTVRARAERQKKTETGSWFPPPSNEPVRETISGLLIALDSLKSRAREKNEACKEILSSVGFQAPDSERSSRRSSRSSFTAKQAETMTSTVKDVKKIGRSSLYLSWSKPEGSPSVSVVGYEIHVNGKLNQKVRNPARLQAVLYSVDLTKETEVQLYAVAETGAKVLLATVAYLDGKQPYQ